MDYLNSRSDVNGKGRRAREVCLPDMNNWPLDRIYRTTHPFGQALFFLPRVSFSRLPYPVVGVSNTHTHTPHPAHPLGISPSGYFSPSSRPASCATQRRVFVHFSSLSRHFFHHLSPPLSLFSSLSTFPYSFLFPSRPFILFFSFMFASEGFFAFSRDSSPSRNVAS